MLVGVIYHFYFDVFKRGPEIRHIFSNTFCAGMKESYAIFFSIMASDISLSMNLGEEKLKLLPSRKTTFFSLCRYISSLFSLMII